MPKWLGLYKDGPLSECPDCKVMVKTINDGGDLFYAPHHKADGTLCQQAWKLVLQSKG